MNMMICRTQSWLLLSGRAWSYSPLPIALKHSTVIPCFIMACNVGIVMMIKFFDNCGVA